MMKQSDILVLDKYEITVDKTNYTLNPLWIYTNWEIQKVVPRSPLVIGIVIVLGVNGPLKTLF